MRPLYQEGSKVLHPLYRKYRRSRAQQLRLASDIISEVEHTLYQAGYYEASRKIRDMQQPIDRATERIFTNI